MTPDIKPYLLEADRQRPDLAITNTSASAFELLQRTLALAGPDWQFVGKTKYDGSQVAPPGFTPFDIDLTRPDGQKERLTVTGVSQDAAWHVPSRRQVKVIAFSAANDPGPWEHGPAHLTPYEIDAVNYRWHNPAVPQFGPGMSTSTPQVPQPPPSRVLPKDQAFEFLKQLNDIYRTELQRPEGIGGDMEAIAQWFYQGVIEGKSIADVLTQIRQSDEWKGKHS